MNKIQNNNNQNLIFKKENNEEKKSLRNLNEIKQEKNINLSKSSKNEKEKNINILDISKIYIKLIYVIENNEEFIRLFSKEFVKRNSKINCGIIFESNIIKLKEFFEINDSQFNKLEIKFYAINNIKSAQYMFYDCISLISFEVKKWESLLTDLSYMFYGCNNLLLLTNISKINTENLTNMSYMFFECISLKEIDISRFNTKKVTKMKYLFKGCILLQQIIGISDLVTENVEEIEYFLCDCSSLEEINSSNWNTKSVKNLNSSFKGCKSLRRIEGIKNWDTSNITEMKASFKDCQSLTDLSEISNWNTSKVVTTKELFNNCVNLIKVSISKWKCHSLIDSSLMFRGCVSLNDLHSIKNIAKNAKIIDRIDENCFGINPKEKSHYNNCDKNNEINSEKIGIT